jgi:hypothetical protein
MARVGSERRIAEAKGKASEVRVLSRGDDLQFVGAKRGAEVGGFTVARL